jgi:hypothetical protein
MIKTKFKVGDVCCYSKKFLKSIMASATDTIWLARGTVTGLKPLGQTLLVEIDWQSSEPFPSKVNALNLSRITPERGICELG